MNEEAAEIQRYEVPVELESDEGEVFQFSQQMVTTFDEHHVYLRFYQVVPPAVDVSGQPPEKIGARLVARLIWPAAGLPSLVQALQEAGQKYELATGPQLAWEPGVEEAP